MTDFSIDTRVSFGDCDPAGIVYYPNYFVWMDRTFHELLRVHVGGHALMCRELGAQGIGLMNTEMNFRSPAHENDLLTVRIIGIDWLETRFEIGYEAHIGERLIFKATELRGVFIPVDGRLRAGNVADLRRLLEQAIQINEQ